MPERFERLTIMNTWLHHEGYEYTDAIRNWNKNWHDGGLFARETPNVGLLMAMTAGLLSRDDTFSHLIAGTLPDFPDEASRQMHDAYLAPFRGLDDGAYNGARRFPLSLPMDSYDNGNGAAQTRHYRLLLDWNKPVHFIWGSADDVFTESWGRAWASRLEHVPGGASFDAIDDAGHFLQNTHGAEVARLLLARMARES
ncbi:MAG: hypothetical protein U5O39_14665 [Gammaproteobacteria bacterium]|nr:hypothetical protein [Gammaproteobacteria bacterium]